jgi:hypothetical protein
MKFLWAFLTLTFSVPSFAAKPQAILGSWRYESIEYQNHIYPNPNTNLDLRFTFLVDGTHILKWTRADEGSFCERTGKYSFDGTNLYMFTTWLNPKNDPSCGADPDMQMGHETSQEIILQEHRLGIVMSLNGERLVYWLSGVIAN